MVRRDAPYKLEGERMNGVIFNGVIRDESRPGWTLACPACNEVVKYTALNLLGGPEPFLYCDECSNFVLRDEDLRHVVAVAKEGNTPTVDQLRQIYQHIEDSLEPCACGGRFTVWANVKCPHCNVAFPYNKGIMSEDIRYFDSKVIWIEGAIAYRGPQTPSNRLASVGMQ